ncbi:winged helix-turn-helix transcriptional regulator, partial [Leptospira santarosai]|nr:winged helix-turn-helix transcriptional regulator [Leptospira santarosai]
EVPVKVEYSLTDKGKGLKDAIANIEQWSKVWLS